MGKRGPKPKTFAAWLRGVGGVRLLCEVEEGEESKAVKLVRNRAGALKWRDAVEAVEALGPSKVEAVDEDGDVLGVWTFAAPAAAAAPPTPPPGYTREPGESEERAMLKVFAHLLSDAYKSQQEGFVSVIQAMGQMSADERKAFASTLNSMDRAMVRMSRSTARFRVSAADATGEGEEEEKDGMGGLFDGPLGEMVGEAVKEAIKGKVGSVVNGKGERNAS